MERRGGKRKGEREKCTKRECRAPERRVDAGRPSSMDSEKTQRKNNRDLKKNGNIKEHFIQMATVKGRNGKDL